MSINEPTRYDQMFEDVRDNLLNEYPNLKGAFLDQFANHCVAVGATTPERIGKVMEASQKINPVCFGEPGTREAPAASYIPRDATKPGRELLTETERAIRASHTGQIPQREKPGAGPVASMSVQDRARYNLSAANAAIAARRKSEGDK